MMLLRAAAHPQDASMADQPLNRQASVDDRGPPMSAMYRSHWLLPNEFKPLVGMFRSTRFPLAVLSVAETVAH